MYCCSRPSFFPGRFCFSASISSADAASLSEAAVLFSVLKTVGASIYPIIASNPPPPGCLIGGPCGLLVLFCCSSFVCCFFFSICCFCCRFSRYCPALFYHGSLYLVLVVSVLFLVNGLALSLFRPSASCVVFIIGPINLSSVSGSWRSCSSASRSCIGGVFLGSTCCRLGSWIGFGLSACYCV